MGRFRQNFRKRVDSIHLNEMQNSEAFRKWLSRQFRHVGNKTWTGDLTNFEVFCNRCIYANWKHAEFTRGQFRVTEVMKLNL